MIKKIILEFKDVKDFRCIHLDMKTRNKTKTSNTIIKIPELKVTKEHRDYNGYRHVDTAYIVNAYDIKYKGYIHIDDNIECEITGKEWSREDENYDD